jgi:GntR family transcriptional regulator
VIPFRVSPEPGVSLYQQVVYPAKKTVVSGQLRVGDPVPSVRELGKNFRINPNTAPRVVTQQITEAILEVHLGVGAVVAKRSGSSAAERRQPARKRI